MKRTYPDLLTYFKESGDTQQAFARRLNRTQSWISKVVHGQLEPSIAEALLISKLAKIPLESLSKEKSLAESLGSDSR
jgi:transcriptional regulator with XRE-family HTH domain